ncbi:hypothetical protein RB598_008974 [Gaeumannomyces tritici]
MLDLVIIPPALPFSTMSVGEGVYWIRNLQCPDKVLDLNQGNSDKGTWILDYKEHETFNTRLNQVWLVERFGNHEKYIIRNAHSNLVLDLSQGSSANGTPILCWERHGGTNQQWLITWSKDVDGTACYHIINVAAGTAISRNEDDSNDFIVGWSIDDGSKQLWSFTPYICPLTYRLRVKSTGRVLDLSNSSSDDGALALAFEQHTAITKRNQLWWLQNRAGSEGYTIQCLETSTVLDLWGGATDNATPISGWQLHGGRNQQWKMATLAGDYQKITNVAGGTVMDAYKDDDEKRVGGWQSHGGNNQQWFLDAVPSPGPGWVLLQNGGTGKFLYSDQAGNIGTTDGPETVFDESVQWRFLQKDYTGVYTLVNRATGCYLRQLSSKPSVSLVGTTDDVAQDWWFLETYEDSDAGLVCVINAETGNTLDHYGGETAEAFDIETENCYRSWKILPATDWLTSFSLINGETGLCLSAQYQREEVRLSTVDDLNEFHAQWVFRKIAEGPLYSIQNKTNNYVLGGSSARWELVVCCEKYFGLRDTSTGKYLAIENDKPTFEDEDMTDRHQCWELASGRTLDDAYDLIYMDDDLLEVLEPFLTVRENGDMKHHIEKRSPKKPAKDKSEWKLPDKSRVHPPDNQTVRQLLAALIELWQWDIVNEEAQPIQTLISFNRAEAERAIGQRLPQSIRNIYTASHRPDTVFRLDRQGYVNMAGGRYVNLQGQYGTNTYFHITLPVGVTYGAEEIRRFLRESLERSTSIVVTPTTCKPPCGGPPYKRDPGSGGGNSWIKWAVTLLGLFSTVKHSEL